MYTLKQLFVRAMEDGNYELAQDILGRLFDLYSANGGFDTAMECIEFEMMVQWFNANTHQEVLV